MFMIRNACVLISRHAQECLTERVRSLEQQRLDPYWKYGAHTGVDAVSGVLIECGGC
jgi:hypothetical protein